jgi:hypothetical protein
MGGYFLRVTLLNYGRHGRMNMMSALELGIGLFHGILTFFWGRCDAVQAVYFFSEAPVTHRQDTADL